MLLLWCRGHQNRALGLSPVIFISDIAVPALLIPATLYKYMPTITNNIHYLENLQTAFLEILSDLKNTKQVTNCFHIVNSEQEFSVTW